ncbi:MAG: beta-N-acetylhexosaminidase [Stappiaceae bacterium]
MTSKNFVSGCAGGTLSPQEVSLFENERPWGLILFARNCQSRQQVKALTASFRQAVNRPQAPVLIDEEGGRVQRLKAPHWSSYPSGRTYGNIYNLNPDEGHRAAWLAGRLIAFDLAEVGVTINCLPVLDVPVAGVSDVIGDRAYSDRGETIIKVASAMCEGMMAGGILPVMKHIPGHGRSLVDSHFDLPVVNADLSELQRDFEPFRHFRGLPFAMTAHLVYRAIDAENPATTSAEVISKIIRADIGFDGCLFSDDISMQALKGSIGERAQNVLAAGCDIALHCNGKFEEMAAVASVATELTGKSAIRAQQGLDLGLTADTFGEDEARREFSDLLAQYDAAPAS